MCKVKVDIISAFHNVPISLSKIEVTEDLNYIKIMCYGMICFDI